MCVQYRGGFQYRWGIHEYRGGVQYRGGYLEYRGECSVLWGDIMSTMGVILPVPWGMFRTVGDIMMHVGGHHEYRGVFCTVEGYHPLKFEYRGGYSVSWGTQITKDFYPHGSEHPLRYS